VAHRVRARSPTKAPRRGQLCLASAALLWNFVVNRRYRGGKPRQYWPFGGAQDTTGLNQWAPAFLTAVNSALVAYQNGLLGLTWTGGNVTGLVSISYYKGFTVITDPSTGRAENKPTPRSSPVVDTITGWHANPGVATQRRRLALD
jgi:hypothetical protein